MLHLRPFKTNGEPIPTTGIRELILNFDERSRARLRARLNDGLEAGLFLERGGVLRDGDLLKSDDGVVVRVRAAAEPVSVVYCAEPLLFARLCYHLGNRHVPLQMQEGRVAFRADHVLDEMVRGLGLEPVCERAPFEPEPGAYDHDHTHAHR